MRQACAPFCELNERYPLLEYVNLRYISDDEKTNAVHDYIEAIDSMRAANEKENKQTQI